MIYRGSPQSNLWFDEIIVDNFAGGGGASSGIESALGRPVDIAINHDPDAIAMHELNHPHTTHYCESVWDVNPREITNGQPVGLSWFSPDCKHFSRAKGATPVNKNIRGLAWVANRWAATVNPRIIALENVKEFTTWGPVVNGRPCPSRKGRTFNHFVGSLREQGYQVDWNLLKASDYGTPTIRERLFLLARNDGQEIVWPTPTHGNPKLASFKSSGLKKYRIAADIIDWSIPCPSIFGRSKPLAENTLQRIYNGLMRYVINDPKPFIVRIGQQGFGGAGMQYPIDSPLTTITTKAEHCLVTSHLIKLKRNQVGQSLLDPMPTLTNVGHVGEVRAFLIKYYGAATDGVSLRDPLHTITGQDRFGLVMVRGEAYQIVDICMRMLEPHELFAAQGFPKNYIIDHDKFGNKIPKYKQVARCGNSVCPALAEALVRANYFSQSLLKAA